MTSPSIKTICILTALSASIAFSGVSFSSSNSIDFKDQARQYRLQGLEVQKQGDLEGAANFYQKAIELDPSYIIPYNDLGVVYDLMGMPDMAEQAYLQALKMNPRYLNVYSNLAMLYEARKDFSKAAYYWNRRAMLGDPKDPWTENAKKRLDALTFMVPELKQKFMEQESINLMQQVEQQKKVKREQDLKAAAQHLELANKAFKSGDYKKTVEEAQLTLSFNSKTEEAKALIYKAQQKLAEIEKARVKKENIQKIAQHYESGMRYYQKDNLQAAKQEFDKIAELTASPQSK
jgi:Flp pilus assembly protein TadD